MNTALRFRWLVREGLLPSGIAVILMSLLLIVSILLFVLRPLLAVAAVALLIGIMVQLFVIEPRSERRRGKEAE